MYTYIGTHWIHDNNCSFNYYPGYVVVEYLGNLVTDLGLPRNGWAKLSYARLNEGANKVSKIDCEVCRGITDGCNQVYRLPFQC